MAGSSSHSQIYRMCGQSWYVAEVPAPWGSGCPSIHKIPHEGAGYPKILVPGPWSQAPMVAGPSWHSQYVQCIKTHSNKHTYSPHSAAHINFCPSNHQKLLHILNKLYTQHKTARIHFDSRQHYSRLHTENKRHRGVKKQRCYLVIKWGWGVHAGFNQYIPKINLKMLARLLYLRIQGSN